MRSLCRWGLVFLLGVLGSEAAEMTEPARQFEFWLGHWEVTTPDGKLAGENVIETMLGGRVLRESYTTAGGYAGHSFNTYNVAEKRWEQYWVDNSGLVLHLIGGLDEAGRMVLQGTRLERDGKAVTDRITWSRESDGTVRQLWEQRWSDDEPWSVSFDGTYRRKEKSGPTASGG